MNQPTTILICALLAGLAPALPAAEPIDKPLPRDEAGVRRDDRKKPAAEGRDARAKDVRKTSPEADKRREQYRNMTPEERAAKRKEIRGRLEKRIVELRAKQANATITPQESRELERREHILSRFDAEMAGPRPKPVLTNSPAHN